MKEKDKLYTIEKGETRVVVSERGGTIVSLTSKGKDILYPLREENGKMRGGCPICSPWFGQSPRGEKKHGHLRDVKSFDTVVTTDNSVSMKFVRVQDELYPWALHHSVTAIIYPDGVVQLSLVVKRLKDDSDKPAPVLPGFHPYFSCQDAGKVEVLIDGKSFSGFSDESKQIPFGGRYALIKMPGQTIEMKFGKKKMSEESKLVLWTDSSDKYVCVEPILEDKTLFDTPGGYSLGQEEWLEVYMILSVIDSK